MAWTSSTTSTSSPSAPRAANRRAANALALAAGALSFGRSLAAGRRPSSTIGMTQPPAHIASTTKPQQREGCTSQKGEPPTQGVYIGGNALLGDTLGPSVLTDFKCVLTGAGMKKSGGERKDEYSEGIPYCSRRDTLAVSQGIPCCSRRDTLAASQRIPW